MTLTTRQTLVGIIARKGSGKDTVAGPLLDSGYSNVKFAGGLKAMLRALLTYQMVDDETIHRMLEGDLKGTPTKFLGGRTPRYAMETLGTEWGRKLICDDFWVDMTLEVARRGPSIITDVRFPNEVEALKWAGGILFGIVADWITPTPGEHESETNIDALIEQLPSQRVLRNRFSADGDTSAVVGELQRSLARQIGAEL